MDSGHRKGLRKRRLSQGKRKPCSAGAPDPRQQIRVICSASDLVFKYKKGAGLELKGEGWGEGGEGDLERNAHWFTLGRSQAFRSRAWGGTHTENFLWYVYALLWKYTFKLIHCPRFSFFFFFFLFCCFYDFQISRDIFGFVLFSVMVAWDYFYNAHFLVSRNSFFFFFFPQITLKNIQLNTF